MKLLKRISPPVLTKAAQRIQKKIYHSSTRAKLRGAKKLHLACGSNPIKGWTNIDLESNGDVIGWDLTEKLPIEAGSIDLIYSEHFIEHISDVQSKQLLAECYDMLRPGGILRISTPDLKKLIEEYTSERLTEWRDVGWLPHTPCQMLNEGVRRWGHQFIYDAPELERVLQSVGFKTITRMSWRDSPHADLRNLECRPNHQELIYEVTK
jgi:predicted SAM-dependent methyltransferase